MLPSVALVGVLVVTVLPASQASAAPATHTPSSAIERLAPYQPQTTCRSVAQPGVVAFRNQVLRAYGGTGDFGIVRACGLGGNSEHKEGRAWDWRASANSVTQVHQVNNMLAWLFATDRYGNHFAQARRTGVMYIIWNHRIWRAYRTNLGWQPYTGAEAHTDHVHISFSWAGALKRTSYWTGVVSPTVTSPSAHRLHLAHVAQRMSAHRRHRAHLTHLSAHRAHRAHLAHLRNR